MNFIDNWAGLLTAELAADGTVLPVTPELLARLDLSGAGEYVLTLTDKADCLNDPAPVYEIVRITAAGLQRGQEGTTAQAWPADTIVFAGITAGMLEALAGAGGGAAPWSTVALSDADDWQGWAFSRTEGDVVRVWFNITALRTGSFGAPDTLAFELPTALRPVNIPFGPARAVISCQGSEGGPQAAIVEIDNGGYLGIYLPPGMSWEAGLRFVADFTYSRTPFPFP